MLANITVLSCIINEITPFHQEIIDLDITVASLITLNRIESKLTLVYLLNLERLFSEEWSIQFELIAGGVLYHWQLLVNSPLIFPRPIATR